MKTIKILEYMLKEIKFLNLVWNVTIFMTCVMLLEFFENSEITFMVPKVTQMFLKQQTYEISKVVYGSVLCICILIFFFRMFIVTEKVKELFQWIPLLILITIFTHYPLVITVKHIIYIKVGLAIAFAIFNSYPVVVVKEKLDLKFAGIAEIDDSDNQTINL